MKGRYVHDLYAPPPITTAAYATVITRAGAQLARSQSAAALPCFQPPLVLA